MAHAYRTIQRWNQWLSETALAKRLLDEEKKAFSTLLNKHFGKQALLIGVPNQRELLLSTRIPCHSMLSPLISHEVDFNYIESDFQELPVLTGSIDVVMLPHTLEFMNNPRQLLSEACRIIKPEGLIVISGFNPHSAWGLRRILSNRKEMPWVENFIQASLLKSWLRLRDFELEEHSSILFRPPIQNDSFHHRLRFLETVGKQVLPRFGGVYILVARAKVIPLTPIRMKWKQRLSNIRISTSVTGHIARRGKAR